MAISTDKEVAWTDYCPTCKRLLCQAFVDGDFNLAGKASVYTEFHFPKFLDTIPLDKTFYPKRGSSKCEKFWCKLRREIKRCLTFSTTE